MALGNVGRRLAKWWQRAIAGILSLVFLRKVLDVFVHWIDWDARVKHVGEHGATWLSYVIHPPAFLDSWWFVGLVLLAGFTAVILIPVRTGLPQQDPDSAYDMLKEEIKEQLTGEPAEKSIAQKPDERSQVQGLSPGFERMVRMKSDWELLEYEYQLRKKKIDEKYGSKGEPKPPSPPSDS